jgi:hypothetical protein
MVMMTVQTLQQLQLTAAGQFESILQACQLLNSMLQMERDDGLTCWAASSADLALE